MPKTPGRGKQLFVIGAALVLLGIIALASQGYVGGKKPQLVDLGPSSSLPSLTEPEPQSGFAIPPVLGLVSLAAGVVLMVVASRK